MSGEPAPAGPVADGPAAAGTATAVPVTLRPAGEHAVLAEYRDTTTVLQVAAALRDLAPVRLLEVVPAERTVLLVGTPLSTPAELAALLSDLPLRPVDAESGTEVVIPVVYDGEDLTEVAGLLGTSTDALIAAHTATRWTAAFGGFAPGFAYLLPSPALDEPPGSGGIEHDPSARAASGPGDDRWPHEVPRRNQPRTTVPAGSVALASRYSGIYPRPSPGGWQLIGRTEAVLFDPGRRDPALLTPGARVRFEARRTHATAPSVGRFAAALRQRTSGSRRAPRLAETRPAFTVLASGPLTLVQDGGRPGTGAIGVSRSGAFDRGALIGANRAVGNPSFAPALELLVGPLRLRADAAAVLAIAGAPCPIAVTRQDTETGDLELEAGDTSERPIALDAGDLVEIGPVTSGLRVVLAVRGGVLVPHQVGSASRDTLSALGPEPLADGDSMSVGPDHGLDAVPWRPAPDRHPDGDAADHAADDEDPGGDRAGRATGADGEPVDTEGMTEVPMRPGPRHRELGQEALGALLGRDWRVRADSDRIGVRLDGQPLPVPESASALPSEPMVPGAIQVPPSGLPVVFGPDGPATGGYPVIGVLTPDGLDLLAQAAPGTTLRFRDASRPRE